MDAKARKSLVRDPVCGMMVEPDRLRSTYRGIEYSFCSRQCAERFSEQPQLYVGSPTQRAPKQQGMEVIKQRRLRLAAPLAREQAERAVAALQAMMGVKSVAVDDEALDVRYDLLLATEEQIETALSSAGVRLSRGWVERVRRAFAHYEESCETGNLAAPGETHCHGVHGESRTGVVQEEETKMAFDPVCKMEVDPATAPESVRHAGQAWYFCSKACLDKFVANPQKYLGDAPRGCCGGTGGHAHK